MNAVSRLTFVSLLSYLLSILLQDTLAAPTIDTAVDFEEIEMFALSVVRGESDDYSTILKISVAGPVSFLAAGTPFQEANQDVFEINPSGAEFTGKEFFLDEENLETLTLSPGETREISMDLSERYAFEAGLEYSVRLKTLVYFNNGDDQHIKLGTSNSVSIKVSDDAVRHRKALEQDRLSGNTLRGGQKTRFIKEEDYNLALDGCTDGQANYIRQVFHDAMYDLQHKALKLMRSGITGDNIFKVPELESAWVDFFGVDPNTPLGDRLNVVRTRLENMRLASLKQPYTFYMSCGELERECKQVPSAVAFVFPERTDTPECLAYSPKAKQCNTFYICPNFFEFLNVRLTIIHELSHMDHIANLGDGYALDYCIGAGFCQFIAQYVPQWALQSADTIALFYGRLVRI